MQELKPPCDCIEKCGNFWIERCECRNSGDLAEAAAWCATANILPDTHRIVPVELLKWALLEIPWALRDAETSTRIRAIIDKEPTK
jgi:hypothetical protein